MSDLKLPLSYKTNVYDSDGFPCVMDANDCVLLSVWDEGRSIDQAESVASEIAIRVNAHDRLVEALSCAAATLEMLGYRNTTENARAILAELDDK